MVEQVGIDQGFTFGVDRPVLKIAVTVSVLAHLAVLAVWKFPTIDVRAVVGATIRVELIPRPVPVETFVEEAVEAVTIDVQQTTEAVPAMPPESREEPATNNATSETIPGKRLITTITSHVEAPVGQTQALDCDLAQRASAVFLCEDEDKRDWQELSSRRYQRFAYDDSTSQFQRDMALSKRLMRRQATLDQMIELVGYVPEDLGAERREVRRMLDSIEDKYATMDLLRIIGAGSKKVANVWEKVKSRK